MFLFGAMFLWSCLVSSPSHCIIFHGQVPHVTSGTIPGPFVRLVFGWQVGSAPSKEQPTRGSWYIPVPAWNPSPNQKLRDPFHSPNHLLCKGSQLLYWNIQLFLVWTGVPGGSILFLFLPYRSITTAPFLPGEVQLGLDLTVARRIACDVWITVDERRSAATGRSRTTMVIIVRVFCSLQVCAVWTGW